MHECGAGGGGGGLVSARLRVVKDPRTKSRARARREAHECRGRRRHQRRASYPGPLSALGVRGVREERLVAPREVWEVKRGCDRGQTVETHSKRLSPLGPAEQLQGGSREISASSFWILESSRGVRYGTMFDVWLAGVWCSEEGQRPGW